MPCWYLLAGIFRFPQATDEELLHTEHQQGAAYPESATAMMRFHSGTGVGMFTMRWMPMTMVYMLS